MLPICTRTVCVPRSKYRASQSDGTQAQMEPKTLGEHLRRRRLELKMKPAEAIGKMGVSRQILRIWEADRILPTKWQQDRIIKFLGYDPFVNSAHDTA